MEAGFLKYALKLTLPSIKYNKKIYIENLTESITV